MDPCNAHIQPGRGWTAWNFLMNNRDRVHAAGIDAAIQDLVADIHAVPANHLQALGNPLHARIIRELQGERLNSLPKAMRAVLFPDVQRVEDEDSDDSSGSDEIAGPFSGLVDTAENILWLVKTAQGALEIGKRSDMLLCAGTTLLEAVDKFFKGEWYGAAIQAAAGTATTVRIYKEVFQQRQGVFQELLGELDSGCKQIQLLAASASKGIENGTRRIIEVSNQLERLEQLSIRIAHVLESAKLEILEAQTDAQKLVEDSKRAFDNASRLMKEAHHLNLRNTERLTAVLSEFQEFYNTLRSEETSAEMLQKQLEEIHKRTEHFLSLFNEISAEMAHADWLRAQGLAAFSEGARLQDEANQAWLSLATTAQQRLNEIKDAKRTQEIGALRRELNEAAEGLSMERERLSALQEISRDMQKVIGELTLEGQGFSYTQVAAGLAVAALTPGIIPGLTAGAATMALLQNPEYIKKGLAILTGVRRREIEDAEIVAYETDNVKVKFDPISSGFWGTVARRPSRTVGSVEVRIIKDHWISLRFDLRNPAKALDMTELGRLMQALGNAEIDHIVHVLAELSLVHIDRGSRHEPVDGLCPAASPFFTELLSQHSRKLEDVAREAERLKEHRSRHPHPAECLFLLDPSGGILGPMRGRNSRSSGLLSIHLGRERLFFQCSLLNRSAMTAPDLMRLSKALTRAVEKGYITQEHGKQCIQKLLTMKIEREDAAPICGLMTRRLLTYIAKEFHPGDGEVFLQHTPQNMLPEGTTITASLEKSHWRLFYQGDIGTLEVRIKEISLPLAFNLDQLSPVNEESMVYLKTFLEDRIRAEAITKEEAIAILNRLQDTIVYDSNHDPHDLFRGDSIENLILHFT